MPLDRKAEDRPVSDFMTPRARLATRPASVTIEEAEQVMFDHRVEKLPLVDDENRIRGLITMRDLKLYKQKPYSTKDERGRLRVGAAIGATGDYLERAAALLAQEVDCILLDVAHADSAAVETAIQEFRKRFAGVPLVCGNVATAAAARWLAGLRRGCDQGGGGAGARLPHPPGDGGGRAPAPGRARGLPRHRGQGADHRRRRRAERQGHLPRHRLRRVHRDAGQPALGHGRGPGHDGRGPGHAARR